MVVSSQTVTVLGSTGSIGVSTLDVLSQHPERFRVFALTADSSTELLAQQCLKFKPEYAVVRDSQHAAELHQQLQQHKSATVVLSGSQSLLEVAEAESVTTVMAAIVGAAGLLPTLAAVKAGKKVLLANKEALVMAGGLFMEAVRQSSATLLPIDSEHNAIFQCLPGGYQAGEALAGVRRVLLTGSGGPFRTWTAAAMAAATPEQACNHPNWSMGKKISVDSATLMNKGLELIEARWLFAVDPADIDIVIHPQSIIHSMVEYADGSVLAQLGHPDMRTPIAHALAWPERIEAGVNALDFMAMGELGFEKPDITRFPGLGLAMQAAQSDSGAATVLNAANEVAVSAFLERRIAFPEIATVIAEAMATANYQEPESIDAVLDLDFSARRSAQLLIDRKLSA